MFTVTLIYSTTKKYTTQVEADYPALAVQEAIHKRPHKIRPQAAIVDKIIYEITTDGFKHNPNFLAQLEFYERNLQNQ